VAALAWNRLSDSEIHELYTVPLEHELCSLYSEYVSADLGSNNTPIDDLLKRTVQCITFVSYTNLPVIKTGKSKKPYWSNTLTSLSRAVKSVWRQWVDLGRPRDLQNPLWLQYKEAKRTFRVPSVRLTMITRTNALPSYVIASRWIRGIFGIL
jgi:hypothetical protein